jgi:hypothetical protein
VLLGMSVDLAQMTWMQGQRRLAERAEELPRRRYEGLERVVAEIVAELARRMGQAFTLADLAAEYESSAWWALDIAQRTTTDVAAHDLSVVQDAAFALFQRNAMDFRS